MPARVFYLGAELRTVLTGPAEDWTPERRATFLLRPEIRFPLSVDPNVWSMVGTRDALPWIAISEVEAQAPESATVIVLGAVAEDASREGSILHKFGASEDLVVDRAWRFLGYDVSDGGISGLANCGFGPEEVDALRAEFGPHLNEHGLFDEVARAFQFRAVSEVRVPEHAPFHVIGIWWVRGGAGES